jgi:hypothetical protein
LSRLAGRVAAAAALTVLVAGCAARPPAIPVGAQVPRFASVPYEPFSREAAVQIALGEWRAFGQPVLLPHQELPDDREREEGLWQRVGLYWWLGVDGDDPDSRYTGIHDENGRQFPAANDATYAWSAAFIDYVMRIAGAGKRFPYSPTHSDYINAARRRGLGEGPDIALTAERPEAYAPQRGDLICLWRGAQPVRYEDLPTSRFPGHCDIVVVVNPGELEVIGGNVDNAVSMKRITVTADGKLARPDGSLVDPDHNWFVVLRVLYAR